MLSSISHIHTLDDLVDHFAAVRANLTDDGVYVLEVQHPKDFVGRAPRATAVAAPWTVEKDGVALYVKWGSVDDPYDHTRQVFSAHVTMQATRRGETQLVHEIVHMRDWTKDELDAAARLGGLTLRELHGDFALDAPFDDSPSSWRMILVFQKR
jgi:hypothetical protein